MVVQFFRGGRTVEGARSAVAYLLNKRVKEGTARVIAGNPQHTLSIIEGIRNKWKFSSGVISFEEKELDPSVKLEIVKEFEKTFFPGLAPTQYNILWVEHTDKGRIELHFLIPRIELTTAKAYNPYLHRKDLSKKDLFQQVINIKYGFTNPKSLKKMETLQLPRKWENKSSLAKKQLHEIIEKGVKSGKLRNRAQIINLLEKNGIEVTRKGKDYISLKHPNTGKKMRLKGVYYGESFGSLRELGEELAKRSQEVERMQERIAELEQELANRIAKDAKYNKSRYEANIKKRSVDRGVSNTFDRNRYRNMDRKYSIEEELLHTSEKRVVLPAKRKLRVLHQREGVDYDRVRAAINRITRAREERQRKRDERAARYARRASEANKRAERLHQQAKSIPTAIEREAHYINRAVRERERNIGALYKLATLIRKRKKKREIEKEMEARSRNDPSL